MRGVASIFILPFEFEDFAITLLSLKRNSAFIDNSISMKVDVTLCLSDEMTDWSRSKLTKEYIEERVTELCFVYLDWCKYELYIERSNAILGCVSHRRRSWKNNPEADFFIWFDTDIFFKDITLLSMINGFKLLKISGYEEFVLTPQIVRQWDTTWDIIVNKNFINKNINYHAEANIYADSLVHNEQINLLQLPTFKFGGGMFFVISKQLLDRIGIPVSFGHYGLEDTFIMYCCILMKSNGFNVHQFVLENLIIGEINKHKTDKTIRNYISSKNRKDEFRKISELNFEREFHVFKQSLLK